MNPHSRIPHANSAEAENYIDTNQDAYKKFRTIYKKKLTEKVNLVMQQADLDASDTISDLDINEDELLSENQLAEKLKKRLMRKEKKINKKNKQSIIK